MFLINPYIYFVQSGGGPSGTYNDPYYDYVTALLHFDGSHNGTTFTDEKSHTVTTNGGVITSETYSKFGMTSMYCDGTDNYIKLTDSGTDFLLSPSGDYTLEAWMWFDPSYGGSWGLCCTEDDKFRLSGDSNRWVLKENGVDNIFVIDWTPTTSRWYHVALVRDGSTCRLYIDGVQIGSSNSTYYNSHTDTDLKIGIAYSGGTYIHKGYIDEFRVTKGICRYPNGVTFSTPVRAFPSTTGTASGTIYNNLMYLFHGDGSDGSTTFTDTGINAITATANGNAQIDTSSSKFGGSSMYFPDETSYISIPYHKNLVMGSHSWTIMGWFKPLGSGTERLVLENGINTSGNINLFVGTDGIRFRHSGNTDVLYSGSIPNNTFTHIAITYDKTTIRIYKNGVQVTSSTTTMTHNLTSTINIGASPTSGSGYRYTGWIDDFTILKGASLTRPLVEQEALLDSQTINHTYPHRYWRISNPKMYTGADYLEISEFQLYNDTTSLNSYHSTDVDRYCTINPNSGTVDDFNDGSTNTRCYWDTASKMIDPSWDVSWDFGYSDNTRKVYVNAVRWAGYDTNNRYMTDVDLQYSDDNKNWYTKKRISGMGPYPGNQQYTGLFYADSTDFPRYKSAARNTIGTVSNDDLVLLFHIGTTNISTPSGWTNILATTDWYGNFVKVYKSIYNGTNAVANTTNFPVGNGYFFTAVYSGTNLDVLNIGSRIMTHGSAIVTSPSITTTGETSKLVAWASSRDPGNSNITSTEKMQQRFLDTSMTYFDAAIFDSNGINSGSRTFNRTATQYDFLTVLLEIG